MGAAIFAGPLVAGGDNDRVSAANLDHKLIAAVERLARALRAARQQVATRHRLSLLGVAVMETLANGRQRRVGDLAAELDVTQPTVSDALAVLANRGLVQRTTDPSDRRSTLVTLTESGRSTAADIASELAPLLAADAENKDSRALTLRVLLGEIARLQAAGVITVNRSCLTCLHYRPPGRQRAQCLLLGMPLPDAALRVDCPEYEPAR